MAHRILTGVTHGLRTEAARLMTLRLIGLLLATSLLWWNGGGPAQAGYAGPMTVTIVRSAKAKCTTLCPQWIAADGTITAATPALFAQSFKAMGAAALPVIVTSNGGDIDAAMKIGRMIRARKLDVAVGKTFYTTCGPSDSGCRPVKGVPPKGVVMAGWGACASACPLILAGGVHRYAGGALMVGVHQMLLVQHMERVQYQEVFLIRNGRKVVIDRRVVSRKTLPDRVTAGGDGPLRTKIAAYLKEMGLPDLMLKLADTTPPARIRALTRQELGDTGLITDAGRAETIVRPDLCAGPPLPPNCVAVAPAKTPPG